MKNSFVLLLLFSALTFACSDKDASDSDSALKDQETGQTESADKGTLEERAKRHVESVLEIPGNEKYALKIYREHLDGDNKKDAIITVNRLEFALDEAVREGNTAKRAELGFMGNYNYIFYYDGGLDKISPEIYVPSTPQKELVVSFENISSEQYKDVLVDFRVRNAKFRDFYFVINHTPRKVFQCKMFDGLGTDATEAFSIRYDEGTMGLQKDILILKSTMKPPSGEIDELTFEPEIKDGKELLYRFFYHPKLGKYAIQK